MSRFWNEEDDRTLLSWVSTCRKMGMSRNQTFTFVANKLARNEGECFKRWKILALNREETALFPRVKKRTEPGHDQLTIKDRIRNLEEQIQASQTKVDQLLSENRKLREEMKFFEMLLLEEYQLLVNLLDKKKTRAKLHSL